MKNLRRPAALALATTAALLTALLTPLGSSAAVSTLPAPSLVAPPNTAGGTPLKAPVLKWNPVSGAVSYEVQVSPSEDWADPANIPLDVTVVSTQYAPSINLPHASYFWRLRSIDAAGAKGIWSDNGAARAWSFTNGWYAAPTPVYPIVAVGGVSDLRFSWTPIVGASFYEVELSRSASFPDPSPLQSNADPGVTYNCFTTNTTVTPSESTLTGKATGPGECVMPGDFGKGQWFWRVRAYDGTDDSVLDVSTSPAASGLDHAAPKVIVGGEAAVSSIAPAFGPATTSVTVTGADFSNAVAVWFGKQRVVLGLGAVSGDHKSITVVAPVGGAGTVYVTVENSDGTKTAENPKATFTFGAATDATAPKGSVSTATGEQSAWSPTAVYSADVQFGGGGDINVMRVTGVAVRANGRDGIMWDACTPDAVQGTPVCATTPTLMWDATPGAAVYRTTIGLDAAFTNVQRRYETITPSLTPIDVLPDNQAGQAYWVAVQPCNADACGAATVTSFRKRGARTILTSPTGYVTKTQVELAWAPIFNQGDGFDPKSYHFQVASDDEFSTIVEEKVVDRTSYVSEDKTYAEGKFFWRVQGIDQSGHAMPWSAPNRDVDQPATFTKDATVPKATATAGAQQLDQPIKVTWSEQVSGSGMTVQTLSRKAVKGSARQVGTSWTFTPRSPWVANETYRVARHGARDLAGNLAPAGTYWVRAVATVDSSSRAMARRTGDGKWRTLTASDATGKSFLQSWDKKSTAKKSSVSAVLKGRYLSVRACKSPKSGQVALYVDRKKVKTLDLYRSYSGCGTVWKTTKKMSNVAHTVLLVTQPTKAKKSGGAFVGVDAISVR